MKKLIIIFLVGYSIFSSCMKGDRENNEDAESSSKIETNISESELDFLDFTKHFAPQSLPLHVCRCDENFEKLFSFGNEKEIPREFALKYLCEDDSTRLIQPTSGFYQYYYGYLLSTGKSFTTIIFQRTSYENYSGFIISTHTKTGKLIDEQFISGDWLEKAQMESLISKNLTIKCVELIMKKWEVQREESICFADKIVRNYSIDDRGNINLINEENLGEKRYVPNEDFWLPVSPPLTMGDEQ